MVPQEVQEVELSTLVQILLPIQEVSRITVFKEHMLVGHTNHPAVVDLVGQYVLTQIQ